MKQKHRHRHTVCLYEENKLRLLQRIGLFIRTRLIQDEKCSYKWLSQRSRNCANGRASAGNICALQCEFVSNVGCKQTAIPFMRLASRLIQVLIYLSRAKNLRLKVVIGNGRRPNQAEHRISNFDQLEGRKNRVTGSQLISVQGSWDLQARVSSSFHRPRWTESEFVRSTRQRGEGVIIIGVFWKKTVLIQ